MAQNGRDLSKSFIINSIHPESYGEALYLSTRILLYGIL